MNIKWTACLLYAAVGLSSTLCLAASERTPFKVQASSTATQYPTSNINDGSTATTWAASPDKTLAGNFIWIQADLGTRRYVDRVLLTSPSAASALGNYAIKISDDGKNWSLAAAEFTSADSIVPLERATAIEKNARYLRIETTKIGDGSGSEAARIAELTLMTEVPRSIGSTFSCDKTVAPSSYVSELEAERGNADGTWKNVCLQPGDYVRPVKMHHMHKVRLLAQNGPVVFKTDQPPFDFSKFPECLAPPGGYTSVFSISESQDIVVKGVTINNESVGGDYRKVLSCGSGIATSRAVTVSDSRNVWFDGSSLVSAGKNTLTLRSSAVVVTGGSISGWYFIADASSSMAYFSGVKFSQRENAQIPADTHTMFSTDMSDVVFDGSSFMASSGNGFLGGSQVSTVTSLPSHKRKWALVGSNTANVSAWLTPVPTSSGYKNNVQIYLTGAYPQLPPFTRINELVEPGTGDRVCSFSPTTGALVGCVGPNLPVVGDVEPKAAGQNILQGIDISTSLSGLTTYLGGTIAADSSVAKSGVASIKVAGAPGSAGVSRAFPPLTPGTAYVFSFWARAASKGGTVNWNIQSGSGDFNCLYGSQIPLSTTWKNYSKTCVLDVSKPRLLIYSHNVSGDATFWIDDIKVRQASVAR